jgi:hypothetical protein
MAINAPGGQKRSTAERKFVFGSQSTAADHAQVAAPGAGKRIVVMGIHASVRTGANTIAFKSATTVIYPPRLLGTALAWEAETSHGLCACETNEALNLTLSAAVATDWMISYIIEDAI